MTRILAFTPTFGDGPRPETIASVAGQRFDGEIEHVVSWENPYPGLDVRNICAQYTRGRELALSGGFDALWTVEHDMWIPEHGLTQLVDAASRGAGVVYGVYLFRRGVALLNAWLFHPSELPWEENMGESFSVSRNVSRLGRALSQKVAPVDGVGNGCTLIRRDVLERIPFRAGVQDRDAPDMPFARDCVKAGIQQVAHFGVLCGHWDGQRWLMPLGSAEMGDTVHVRAIRNMVVELGGGAKELIGGREYDVPAYEVKQLLRGGFVTVLAQRPAPERAVARQRETRGPHAAAPDAAAVGE